MIRNHLDEYLFDEHKKELFIRGWVLDKDFKIIVNVDGKELLNEKGNEYRFDLCEKYTNKEDKNNYGFEFTINLDNNYKKSKVYFKTKNRLYKMYSEVHPTTPLEAKVYKVTDVTKKIGKVLVKRNITLLNPKLLKKYIDESIERKQIRQEAKECVNPNNTFQYRLWIEEKNKREKEEYKKFKYNPLISILVPVYNVPIVYLKACIDSVLNNIYENFELCIADDCSTDPKIRKVLEEYSKKDKRVKVVFREKNGHISNATNSALEIAKGEYISLLDNDDTLTEDALYQVVKALNENKNLELIYSDEDKLDLNENLCFPTYKPDWSPDLFSCYNYLCHFTTIKKSVVDKIKGFRVGYEGAQDYDIFLRVVSNIKDENIYHIPKILYHWRMISGSTAAVMSNKDYAFERGRKALQDFYYNKKIKCEVGRVKEFPYYLPKYINEKEDLVTIIVDKVDKKQVSRFKSFNDYKNYEVIYINEEDNLLDVIKKAKGKYISLMESDVYLRRKSSMKNIINYLGLSHVGVVSPSLRNSKKNTISSGVVLFKDHFEHVNYIYNRRSTKVEPKLKINVNYTVPSTKVLFFEKDKFLKTNSKCKVKGFPKEIEMIKICLNFIDNNYYNVVTAYNKFTCYKKIDEKYDVEEYKKLDIKEDKFYNKNLSETHIYKLDKFE